jgi:hypothetical protein
MAGLSQASGPVTDFLGAALPLSGDGLDEAADTLRTTTPTLWAVVSVETHGCGFLPDRRPAILFERHIFHRRTHGAFDNAAPDISSSSAGGYLGGAAEYTRLERAIALDRDAALESASWGLGQIMGFNAAMTRFQTAEAMIAAMLHGEDAHLQAMTDFLVARRLDKPLAKRDWAAFARGYNGVSYKKNQYDTRLASAYAALRRGPMPDLAVRQAQLLLTFLGFAPGVIDGVLGKRTRSAVVLFRQQQGLGSSDAVNGPLLDALEASVNLLPA